MQRRQSRAHMRVRTHFVCHTLSPELRSVTLNYNANKTCRPKQRASLPHTHIHTKCYHLLKESVMVTLYFSVYKCHVTCSYRTSTGRFEKQLFLIHPFIHLQSLCVFQFGTLITLSLGISLSFPSSSLYFPLASINASVETINKNNDLFKNPQYGSLANEVAGDKLPRLLLTPSCLLIPHVFLNVGSGLYFKTS